MCHLIPGIDVSEKLALLFSFYIEAVLPSVILFFKYLINLCIILPKSGLLCAYSFEDPWLLELPPDQEVMTQETQAWVLDSCLIISLSLYISASSFHIQCFFSSKNAAASSLWEMLPPLVMPFCHKYHAEKPQDWCSCFCKRVVQNTLNMSQWLWRLQWPFTLLFWTKRSFFGFSSRHSCPC